MNLYAAVVLAAFFGVVGVDRFCFAATFRLQSLRSDTTFDEVFHNRLGASFGQFLVRFVFTYAVGVTYDLNTGVRMALRKL